MTAMLKWIEIASSSVAGYLLKWRSIENFGDSIKDIEILVGKDIYNTLPDLASGDTLQIKRGFTTSSDYWVFDGYVDTANKEGPVVRIKGKDKMIDLVRASINYSYDGIAFPATEAKGSDIMTDLIETHGGMTADVVDTGTAVTIKKFVCRGTDVFSRLKVLINLYDYQVYYNPSDGKVHCEPKGYTSRIGTLTVGGSILNVPKWVTDNTQCVNRLIVKGAVQEVQDTESYNGDGVEDTFTLPKKPISTNVVVDGVEQTPGVEGSTAGTYDYTVDKENNQIIFESGSIPGGGVNNVVVKYVNSIPVPVQVEDADSIDKYRLHRAEKYFEDIQTVADAEKRGVGWLDKYSVPFVTTELKVNGTIDFEVGQSIRVVDNIQDEDRTLVINKIVQEHPYKYDVLTIGDKEWKTEDWGHMTLERIRRLEESNQGDTELLVQVHRFVRHIAPHRRYFNITKNVASSVKFWGHPRNKWNTSAGWGTNAYSETDTLMRRVWPYHKYIETFIDTDFQGSGTATWDTANKKLVF